MKQKTALITGASSGIGATYAKYLGAQGYALILVARREEKLKELQNYSDSVEYIPADLTTSAGIELVENRITSTPIDLLINNAGYGTTGKFFDIDLQKQMDMITLHVNATVCLTRAALPGMVERKQGAIINVSSIAAFLPTPGNVIYSATKNFMVTFTEALQTELISTGVHVQVLCPGFTFTEFHDTVEYSRFKRETIPKFMWMSADEVTKISLKALQSKKTVVTPGIVNKVMVPLLRNRFLSRMILVPVRAISRVMFGKKP